MERRGQKLYLFTRCENYIDHRMSHHGTTFHQSSLQNDNSLAIVELQTLGIDLQILLLFISKVVMITNDYERAALKTMVGGRWYAALF